MAVYQFEVKDHPEHFSTGLLDTSAIRFVRDAFQFRGHALEIQDEDLRGYVHVRTRKKRLIARLASQLFGQDTLKEIVEIEFSVNRCRIKGEIQGKQGMGLEGNPVLKIKQRQEIDRLGAPPRQPRVRSTRWICEMDATIENDFEYLGRLAPLNLPPPADIQGGWNRFKLWLTQVGTVFIFGSRNKVELKDLSDLEQVAKFSSFLPSIADIAEKARTESRASSTFLRPVLFSKDLSELPQTDEKQVEQLLDAIMKFSLENRAELVGALCNKTLLDSDVGAYQRAINEAVKKLQEKTLGEDAKHMPVLMDKLYQKEKGILVDNRLLENVGEQLRDLSEKARLKI